MIRFPRSGNRSGMDHSRPGRVDSGARAPWLRIIAVLVWACLAWPALAGSTQTGTIRGRVIDTKHVPIPGAMVTLRSEALIRERVTLTDAEGNFFAAGLPVGKYQVVAQLTGFSTEAVITEVQIDKTTLLAVTLREGEMTELVTVTSEKPVVSKTQTDWTRIVDLFGARLLPVNRTYQAILQLAPGVTGGANPNVLGGTAASNQYLTDGVSIRDPLTGTFGSNMVFDAIEATELKLSGISAEYGGFQGGMVNMITRSGGNSLTGSVRDVVTQGNFLARFSGSSQDLFRPTNTDLGYQRPGIPGRNPASEKRNNQFQFTLGGPIVVDRAWFFLAYDTVSSSNPGDLGNGRSFPNRRKQDFTLGKSSWQVSDDQRLQLFYQRDPARLTTCYGGFWNARCYEEATVDMQRQGGFLYVVNWNAVWNPTVLTDLKVARFQNDFNLEPLAEAVDIVQPRSSSGKIGLAVVPGFYLLDTNVFAAEPEKRSRDQIEGSASLFLNTRQFGTHAVKFGLDLYRQKNRGSSAIRGGALFTITEIRNQGPVNVLENRHYQQWIDYPLPRQVGAETMLTTLYAQDDWVLNPRWSFNLGLRLEKSVSKNDVGRKVFDDLSLAPRLGASWDPNGTGRHLVKGTFARYLTAINLATMGPLNQISGGQSVFTIYTNTATAPGAPGYWGTPIWKQALQVVPGRFEKGLKPQRIDETTLGYELAFSPEMGLGVRFIDRKWSDIATLRWDYRSTAAGTERIQTLRLNPDAQRSYRAWVVSFDRKYVGGWSLSANFVRSKAEGNVEDDTGGATLGAVAGVPQFTDFADGPLSYDRPDQFKLQGSYQIPLPPGRHRAVIGLVFDYRSGAPYQKNFTESNVVVGPGPNGVQDFPLGHQLQPGEDSDDWYEPSLVHNYDGRKLHRSPPIKTVDLSLSYTFTLSRKLLFETRLEVFNAANWQKPLNVSSQWITGKTALEDSTNYLFGFPLAYTDIQQPRRFQLQFALLW